MVDEPEPWDIIESHIKRANEILNRFKDKVEKCDNKGLIKNSNILDSMIYDISNDIKREPLYIYESKIKNKFKNLKTGHENTIKDFENKCSCKHM